MKLEHMVAVFFDDHIFSKNVDCGPWVGERKANTRYDRNVIKSWPADCKNILAQHVSARKGMLQICITSSRFKSSRQKSS